MEMANWPTIIPCGNVLVMMNCMMIPQLRES